MLPEIQNVVSTVNLMCTLDLKELSRKAINIEYNCHKWAPAAIMRLKKPRTTALVFSSGKMVCAGAKSENESKIAARRFARIILKAGFGVSFKDFKIANIVGSCDVNFKIYIEKLYMQNRNVCSYDPTLFPGLTYRCDDSGANILVFSSGKIILTKLKNIKEMEDSFNLILPKLIKNRK